jgi:hypothetical protein
LGAIVFGLADDLELSSSVCLDGSGQLMPLSWSICPRPTEQRYCGRLGIGAPKSYFGFSPWHRVQNQPAFLVPVMIEEEMGSGLRLRMRLHFGLCLRCSRLGHERLVTGHIAAVLVPWSAAGVTGLWMRCLVRQLPSLQGGVLVHLKLPHSAWSLLRASPAR